MGWIAIVFKIVCPDEIDGQPNIEGQALADELNERCEKLERDQEAVWNEFYQIDDELIEKYQLTVSAFADNQQLLDVSVLN